MPRALWSTHAKTPLRHYYEDIIKKTDPQTKTIIFKFLKDLKFQTKQDQFKIIQEALLLIKKIKAKSLEKLLNIEKRLDEYIGLCDTLDEILLFKTMMHLICNLAAMVYTIRLWCTELEYKLK